MNNEFWVQIIKNAKCDWIVDKDTNETRTSIYVTDKEDENEAKI